jgi:hypothetical protein
MAEEMSKPGSLSIFILEEEALTRMMVVQMIAETDAGFALEQALTQVLTTKRN